MFTAADEPLWEVDLLDTKLRDKSKLVDAIYPGHPDKIAWRYCRPGVTCDCGASVYAFCKSDMAGAVWEANTYYALRSFSRPPLTNSLKFPGPRMNRAVATIIKHLKNGKAVVVGLARGGPHGQVKLTGKNNFPLQSFHAVAIVACDKPGFCFLYLDSVTIWSNCYYKGKRYCGMGYIVCPDALVAPYMNGEPAVVIWGP